MSWLSSHLNGVILQTFTKLLVERSTSARRALDEPARRASSSSQLHRVNGVLGIRSYARAGDYFIIFAKKDYLQRFVLT